MKKHIGFTLIELMITLGIVAILLTVGVPSLKSFMQGNQLIATSNEILSALHVARNEAIKLNARVTICESDDGLTCTGSDDWKGGWIVFVDANGDGVNTEETCADANEGTDCILRIHDAINDNQLTVTANNDISAFTFTSRGLPKATNGASQSGIFSVCSTNSDGDPVGSRAVVLSLSGRSRVSDNTAVITC